MIILRSKWFSSKKKTDEETQRQKKDRKGLATTAGILTGGTAGILADTAVNTGIENKKTEIIDKELNHLYKINSKHKDIQKKIISKYKELINDPKIKEEGIIGKKKLEIATTKLLKENAEKALDKMNNLSLAKDRLIKRLEKKGLKYRGAALLGSAALGTAAGLAANNNIKKQNKKVNRFRRHIED